MCANFNSPTTRSDYRPEIMMLGKQISSLGKQSAHTMIFYSEYITYTYNVGLYIDIYIGICRFVLIASYVPSLLNLFSVKCLHDGQFILHMQLYIFCRLGQLN